MKKSSILFLLTIVSTFSYSQNCQSDFVKYVQLKDTLNQYLTLEKWEKQSPGDPELYTSYFNYYYGKSREEVLTLSTDQPEGETLVLKDSVNKTAGYIGSQIDFNDRIFKKAIEKIEKGIELFPNRLDMRFGEIYAFGQVKDWDNFSKTIIKAIQYSATNNNKWTWTNNELKEDGKNMFLSSLQDYQLQLYNTEDNNLLVNMRDIANEILKFYPDHIESLSNLSITYMLNDEFDKAINALLKAEKINGKDYIVLSNLAQAYKLNGDKANAIAYYEKTIKYGDKDAKSFAKKQIEGLKK